MWGETVLKVLPIMENKSTVLCKNVESVTDIIRRGNVNVGKHTGWMNVEVHKQVEKNFIQGSYSVLMANLVWTISVSPR